MILTAEKERITDQICRVSGFSRLVSASPVRKKVNTGLFVVARNNRDSGQIWIK